MGRFADNPIVRYPKKAIRMRKFMINQWMEWGNPLLDKPIWVWIKIHHPPNSMIIQWIASLHSLRLVGLCFQVTFLHISTARYRPCASMLASASATRCPNFMRKFKGTQKGGEKKQIIVCCCRRGNSCLEKKYCCWASALVSCAKYDDHKSGKTSCATSNKK